MNPLHRHVKRQIVAEHDRGDGWPFGVLGVLVGLLLFCAVAQNGGCHETKRDDALRAEGYNRAMMEIGQ